MDGGDDHRNYCMGVCSNIALAGDESVCRNIPNTAWDHSIHVPDMTQVCTIFANTASGSCNTWCAAHGLRCQFAQDNDGGCAPYPGHDRQSTANNGCDQTWGNQLCGCSQLGSGHRRLEDDHPDNENLTATHQLRRSENRSKVRVLPRKATNTTASLPLSDDAAPPALGMRAVPENIGTDTPHSLRMRTNLKSAESMDSGLLKVGKTGDNPLKGLGRQLEARQAGIATFGHEERRLRMLQGAQSETPRCETGYHVADPTDNVCVAYCPWDHAVFAITESSTDGGFEYSCTCETGYAADRDSVLTETLVCVQACPGAHQQYEEQRDGALYICDCDAGFMIDPRTYTREPAELACVKCGTNQEAREILRPQLVDGELVDGFSFQSCQCTGGYHLDADDSSGTVCIAYCLDGATFELSSDPGTHHTCRCETGYYYDYADDTCVALCAGDHVTAEITETHADGTFLYNCICETGYHHADGGTSPCVQTCPGAHQRFEAVGDYYLCDCDAGYGIDPNTVANREPADRVCVKCRSFQETVDSRESTHSLSYQTCRCVENSRPTADGTACECNRDTNATCVGSWSPCAPDCSKAFAVTSLSCTLDAGAQCEQPNGAAQTCEPGDGECTEEESSSTLLYIGAVLAVGVLVFLAYIFTQKGAGDSPTATPDVPTDQSTNPVALPANPGAPPGKVPPEDFGSWN